MTTANQRLDQLRADGTELENHYIDELIAGRLNRRDFLRRGSVIGMSATTLGLIVSACGGVSSSGSASSSSPGGAPKASRGGTLRLAAVTPAGAINPITVADSGGACMLAMTGEFLILDSNLQGRLVPMLATSWAPNHDGSVWTVKLRSGVKFHNGQPFTADDVVYTFQQLANPKDASNALSALTGVLSPSGVRKVDASTVAFHLEAPNGNFPYILSTDNYNAIIVPNGTDFKTWQKTFVGTGAFKLSGYTPNVGASFVANPAYWGGKPYLDGVQYTFYADQAPQITALAAGNVDAIPQIAAFGSESILHNSSVKVIKTTSANHNELSMRCDQAPFTDQRVRQAMALALNRPQMIPALLSGYGTVGNDSPFGPRFASTDTSVPQRAQDLAKAKQLLAAAGHPNGFTVQLDTCQYEELAELAQVIKADAAKVGINLNLNVMTQTAYFGNSTYGNSPWLDATVSMVYYSDRGSPNVYLEAPLTSKGTWNAAHFHNKTYDGLVAQYVAAVDLQTQKQIAGKIEQLLLAETPLIIPYFSNNLTVAASNVYGLDATAEYQIFLSRAYKA